jgi:hypothetical protein
LSETPLHVVLPSDHILSDLNNMYVVDSTALMATQKYGKVRIGQAIRSESGVNFDLWVLSHFVTNSGFDRWVLRN